MARNKNKRKRRAARQQRQRAKQARKPDAGWQPFQDVTDTTHVRGHAIGHLLRAIGARYFMNNHYAVETRPVPALHNSDGSVQWPAMIHLSIRRLDREAVHDWRDFQRIKNELVGPEHEAVELYPAESRLMDTANQYHVWALAEPMPEMGFPFGQQKREVMEQGDELPEDEVRAELEKLYGGNLQPGDVDAILDTRDARQRKGATQ